MQESMQSARLMAHALWEVELDLASMRAGSGTTAMPMRPVLERRGDRASTLHMPAIDGFPEGSQRRAIHAAAAHAAAHLRFGSGHADDTAIKPLHQAILGVLEDARVESLAMAELPGLRLLWRHAHEELATGEVTLDALIRRLARVLFDPTWKDDHPWVEKGRRLYLEARPLGWVELRRAASILANDVGQMRLRFDSAGYRVQPAYRDDNTHLWKLPDGRAIASLQALDQQASGEASSGGTASQAQDDAPELRPLGVVPEWDRLISRYRADWCTLVEMPPQESDPAMLSAQMTGQATWIAGLARRLRSAAPTRPRRVHAGARGDIDETGLIDAGIALRSKGMPDANIYLDATAVHAPRSIVFLLDASVSTAGEGPPWLTSAGARLLDGMAWITMLACAALEKAGHHCTILGFNSNTRHCVRLQAIKDADEPVSSSPVLARLAGLTPDWSTRTGAAVRYAMRLLNGAGGSMIVLVSDGNPHDVDIHDPRYLPEDLQRAAQEAGKCGVNVLGFEVAPDGAAALSQKRVPGWPRVRATSLSMIADVFVHALRRRAR